MGCLPVTSKCCFFVPLRPGLLTWAYIRMIIVTAMVGFLLYATLGLLHRHARPQYPDESGHLYGLNIQMLVYLGLCLVDLIFSITFIVSLHLKNYKSLLVYYVYAIIEVVGTFSIVVLQFIFLANMHRSAIPSYIDRPWHIVVPLVVNILLPIYFLILIRSELLKIKAGGNQSDQIEGNTHAVLNMPKVTKQDIQYVFGQSKSEPTQSAVEYNEPNPVFPVEELRIERLRQELEGNNV